MAVTPYVPAQALFGITKGSETLYVWFAMIAIDIQISKLEDMPNMVGTRMILTSRCAC